MALNEKMTDEGLEYLQSYITNQMEKIFHPISGTADGHHVQMEDEKLKYIHPPDRPANMRYIVKRNRLRAPHHGYLVDKKELKNVTKDLYLVEVDAGQIKDKHFCFMRIDKMYRGFMGHKRLKCKECENRTIVLTAEDILKRKELFFFFKTVATIRDEVC